MEYYLAVSIYYCTNNQIVNNMAVNIVSLSIKNVSRSNLLSSLPLQCRLFVSGDPVFVLCEYLSHFGQ